MSDVRPFEEYKEMIKDMRKEEMIKGLYDLSARVIKQENIIKEVREDLDKQIEFCTNEANGTTNDKYCRIAINYLKHLKDKLDKGE